MCVCVCKHVTLKLSYISCNMSVCRSIQRKYTTGRPDQKDLNENLAATQGLAHMITECQHLFQVRTHERVTFAQLMQAANRCQDGFHTAEEIRLCF